jgi:hypothetical protein
MFCPPAMRVFAAATASALFRLSRELQTTFVNPDRERVKTAFRFNDCRKCLRMNCRGALLGQNKKIHY